MSEKSRWYNDTEGGTSDGFVLLVEVDVHKETRNLGT